MSNDDKTEPADKTEPVGGISVPIPTVFANETNVVLGRSEASIVFSFLPIGADVKENVVRVVLSHDSFIRMVDFWALRTGLLKRLYRGSPMSLDDLIADDREAFFREWNGFFGGVIPAEEVPEENE